VLHVLGLNPALIDLYCRCKHLAAFTIAFVAMRKSLFVIVVTAVIAIVPKAVAKWPA
jgi:hypothetical protein